MAVQRAITKDHFMEAGMPYWNQWDNSAMQGNMESYTKGT